MVPAIVSLLIAVVVAVAVAYAAWAWVRLHPDKAAKTLTKLGAQVPTPGNDPPDLGDPDAGASAPPPTAARPSPIVQSNDATASGAFVLVSADGSRLALDEGRHEIGREIGLSVSLPAETTVSRRHAAITISRGEATVEDLGSTNGTTVGGNRVAAPTALRPGDVIRFGTAEYRVA